MHTTKTVSLVGGVYRMLLAYGSSHPSVCTNKGQVNLLDGFDARSKLFSYVIPHLHKCRKGDVPNTSSFCFMLLLHINAGGHSVGAPPERLLRRARGPEVRLVAYSLEGRSPLRGRSLGGGALGKEWRTSGKTMRCAGQKSASSPRRAVRSLRKRSWVRGWNHNPTAP